MGGQPAGPQHSGVETVSPQQASFAQFLVTSLLKFTGSHKICINTIYIYKQTVTMLLLDYVVGESLYC